MEKLIDAFEENIKKLTKHFQDSINDYFFTEKEIHSFFYHLCADDFKHNRYCLIHTEYPSPFKCSCINNEPYIKQERDGSTKKRCHIDLVLVNPNFIDWLKSKQGNNKEVLTGIRKEALTGIRNKLFSDYITEFREIYLQFNKDTEQPILLYALEFKFLRHSSSGTKNPKIEFLRDIEKLKLLRECNSGSQSEKIDFVKKTKALIFIGDENKNAATTLKKALDGVGQEEYEIVLRNSEES